MPAAEPGALGATYPSGVDSTANPSSRSDSTAFQTRPRHAEVVGERGTRDRAVAEGVEQRATRVHVDEVDADAQKPFRVGNGHCRDPDRRHRVSVKRRALPSRTGSRRISERAVSRLRRKTQGLTGERSGMQPSKEREASDGDPMDDLDGLLDDDLAGGEEEPDARDGRRRNRRIERGGVPGTPAESASPAGGSRRRPSRSRSSRSVSGCSSAA